MALEDLIGQGLQVLFWLGVIYVIGKMFLGTVNKVGDVLKTRNKVGPTASNDLGSNIRRYGSALEMVQSMRQGCEIQLNSITAACRDSNTEPLKDVGYKTVQEQLVKLRGYEEKLSTNPLYATADSMGWPLLQTFSKDAEKWLKALMKGEM